MKYPTTRLVFDRKKQATRQKTALVQVEILLAGKKKYVTTGVKLYADQWDRKAIVRNSHDAETLRERIAGVKGRIDGYINEAVRREYIDGNPYQALRFDRGEQEMRGYLTDSEVAMMREAVMPTESLERVRDMFLLQCYTGMAYADLADFDRSKVEERGGRYILSDDRHKTGKGYYVVLMPVAVAILEKYGWKLPVISNVQYNMRLKVVATAAGIDRPITSHYARRTAGMMFLNAGMSIEVVARILGHGNIRTTQKAYAQILNRTVEEAFELMEENK